MYNQQGISPMLKALNEQSADSYYDLLGNKLVPVAKQFDNDMQAFRAWSEARGKAEVSAVQASKTRVLILIIVAALLTAGIIVLAGWFCAICCSSRFQPRLPSWNMWRPGI